MSSNSQRTMRTARRRLWWRTYRQRMTDGLERCRKCGTPDDLTFDHIVAAVYGSGLTLDNATILCEPCNAEKGSDSWGELVSLAEEEAAAPPDRRWCEVAARRAYEEARERPGRPWAPWEVDLLSTAATPAEISAQIGRPVKAVRNQRHRLAKEQA